MTISKGKRGKLAWLPWNAKKADTRNKPKISLKGVCQNECFESKNWLSANLRIALACFRSVDIGQTEAHILQN
ncbi:hypothetical protein CUN63_26385 [Pseudomonas sp. ACM7]|nr:hypothetical protein CUN63_26385 [Pseudomonas sp. ACM7]